MQPERELPVLWRRVVTWMAGERAFPRMEADRRQTFREIISKSAEYSLDRLITLEDRAAEPIAQSDVGLLRPTRFERTSFGDILGFFHLFIQPPDGVVRIFEFDLKGAPRTFALFHAPPGETSAISWKRRILNP
jgi:hypothetical protein